MSQHTFKDNSKYVQIGWDKPLQQYYCLVATDPDFDEIIYSNMDDANAFRTGVNIDYFRRVLLQDHNIRLPASIQVEVEKDREKNAVSRYVNHMCEQ